MLLKNAVIQTSNHSWQVGDCASHINHINTGCLSKRFFIIVGVPPKAKGDGVGSDSLGKYRIEGVWMGRGCENKITQPKSLALALNTSLTQQ